MFYFLFFFALKTSKDEKNYKEIEGRKERKREGGEETIKDRRKRFQPTDRNRRRESVSESEFIDELDKCPTTCGKICCKECTRQQCRITCLYTWQDELIVFCAFSLIWKKNSSLWLGKIYIMRKEENYYGFVWCHKEKSFPLFLFALIVLLLFVFHLKSVENQCLVNLVYVVAFHIFSLPLFWKVPKIWIEILNCKLVISAEF